MATRCTVIEPALYDYIVNTTVQEPEVLARLAQETAGLPESECRISAEQGQFMALLVRLMGARRALEVGTFTGYSSTVVALALPPDGRLICCDASTEWTSVARRYWKEAGVADRVELRLGPAAETLDRLASEGLAESFDFAFVDADKGGYAGYYEQCMRLVRKGGLILFDNMLAKGRVLNADDGHNGAVRDLNARVGRDDRVHASLLSIGDGLLMAMRK